MLVSGLMESQRYGRISDPGMGPQPPLELRDVDVGSRDNSRLELTL